MDNTTAAGQTDKAKRAPKQAALPASVGSMRVMNPYLPYLIAFSFIAMTALLTLLLTFVMGNQSGLERTIAFKQADPLLADARIAFGQSDVGSYPGTGTRPTQPAVTAAQVTGNIPLEPATTSTPGPVPVSPDGADFKLRATVQAAQQTGTRSGQVAALDTKMAVSPRDEGNDIQSSPAIKTNPEVNSTHDISQDAAATLTLDDAYSTLEKIIASHHERIRRINHSISQQASSRQQLESAVIRNMGLLDAQIRQLEQGLRPDSRPDVAAYERLLSKRHYSFERMLQRRLEIMQRADWSRDRLRENYSQLLEIIRNESGSNSSISEQIA